MNNKQKAKVVTAVIFAFILLLCSNLVALFPAVLVWVLFIFAIPGAWWFCKVAYLWLTTEDTPFQIKLPKHRKKNKTYMDYAEGNR